MEMVKRKTRTIPKATELVWDDWQNQVLATKGNRCICTGRQVGKSTVISKDAGDFALNNPNVQIMIISAVERQALLLFEKVLSHIHTTNPKQISSGQDKPTKHELKLKNGSIIRCLPTGLTGYGIRGYTIDRLYADEAAFIPEEVWQAVTPMLATTGGDITLLSTPFGRENYFYRCFHDEDFTSFQISSVEVAEKRQEPQRTKMLDHYRKEKERMPIIQYRQEYLGEFVEEAYQFFPDKIIRDCMKSQRQTFEKDDNYFLGIDVGGRGGDETTFEILKKNRTDKLIHVENLVRHNDRTTTTTKEILELNQQYNFREILIDDGGLGVGVFDQLLEEDQTKRKTIAINNASRPLSYDKTRRKKILKEDLYNNLLRLMELGRLALLDDENIFMSLRSVQYVYDDGVFKIFGKNTHITEGLIRAAWGAKGKHLNLFVCRIKT